MDVTQETPTFRQDRLKGRLRDSSRWDSGSSILIPLLNLDTYVKTYVNE